MNSSLRQQYKQNSNQQQSLSFYNIFTVPNLVRLLKFSLWCTGLYLSCFISFQKLYFIFSIFYLIFTNLGKRKSGQMSAYSVFNKGFKRIPGTFSPEDMIMRRGGNIKNNQQQKIMDIDEEAKAKTISQYFQNTSKYGNKLCYCGSQTKFKKCCLVRKKKQQQEERQNRKNNKRI